MNVGNLVGQDMGRQLPKEEEEEREEEGYKGRRRDSATVEAEGDKAKSRSGNDCCSCSAPPLPTRRVSGVSIAKID